MEGKGRVEFVIEDLGTEISIIILDLKDITQVSGEEIGLELGCSQC